MAVPSASTAVKVKNANKIQGFLVPFWDCRKCQIASNHSLALLHAQEELSFALNYDRFSEFSTLLYFYSQGKPGLYI